ncbi:MAG: NUDIX hydrolase [Caldilineales bacterium]|nr:NUDIX hydrolase [Caldilineales bacterium]
MSSYHFCPMCAQPLTRRHAFGRERPVCPACGWVHFQDPKLAVGALVQDEAGRVLLIRRAVIPRIGFWAVPSGFVEHDEQPREALQREIAEETGIQAEIGRVIDLFPNADARKSGPFFLFEAYARGGELRPGDDVSDARWFGPEDAPWDALAFAQLAGLLAQLWGREQP